MAGVVALLTATSVLHAEPILLECNVTGSVRYSGDSPEAFREAVQVEVEELRGTLFIFFKGSEMEGAMSSFSGVTNGRAQVAKNLSTPNTWELSVEGSGPRAKSSSQMFIDRRTGQLVYKHAFHSLITGRTTFTDATGRCEKVASAPKF